MCYSPWDHKEVDTTEQLTHTHCNLRQAGSQVTQAFMSEDLVHPTSESEIVTTYSIMKKLLLLLLSRFSCVRLCATP